MLKFFPVLVPVRASPVPSVVRRSFRKILFLGAPKGKRTRGGCASGMRLLGPALACWCVSSVSASGYRFDAIQSKRGVQHADIQPLLSDNAVVGLIMMLFLVLFCFGKQ